MILVWAKHQSGSAAAAIDYLLDRQVTKLVGRTRTTVHRSPAPEVLRGSPEAVGAYIDGLPFVARYRSATLSMAEEDVPVRLFNAGDPLWRRKVDAAISLFLQVSFSGIPARSRPPVLVATHTHLGRLEINMLMPRGVGAPGETLRSWNPHPPLMSSRRDWDAFVDVVNDVLGWADPRCPIRRRWISGPSWMQKEIAEHLRRVQAGENVRLDLDDPRYRAFALCRSAVRRHGSDRAAVIEHVNVGLAAQGWGVTSASRDGLTCGPLGRPGTRVTFRGAALGDGIEDAIDPHHAMIARQKEVAEALPRLRKAMARRATANSALGGWQRLSPPDPLDVLLGVAKPKTLAERLTMVIARIATRFRLSVRALLLTETIMQFPVAPFRATADHLEAFLDQIRRQQRAFAESRTTHRSVDPNAVPRCAPARRSHGRVLAGADEDRPEHVRSRYNPDDPRAAIGGHGDTSRRGERRRPDDKHSGRHDRAPIQNRNLDGRALPATWSRGQWMREVGQIASGVVGNCRLAWSHNRNMCQALSVIVGPRTISFNISDLPDGDALHDAVTTKLLAAPMPESSRRPDGLEGP